MTKYYRVIKENFLWEVGTIISNDNNGGDYLPADDVFANKYNPNEYISDSIVENTPEYFERVYKLNLVNKIKYLAEDKYRDLIKKSYK